VMRQPHAVVRRRFVRITIRASLSAIAGLLVVIAGCGRVATELTNGGLFGPSDYAGLVAQAEAGSEAVDFRAMRLAYLKSPAHERARKEAKDLARLQNEMFQAARENDHARVGSAARQILAVEYVNLFGQKFLGHSCAALHDDVCAKQHRFVELGLLRSIVSSGDGASCDTSWEVISIQEEYFVLSMRGTKLLQQAPVSGKRHSCDEMKVTDEQGIERTYYFNVDALLADEAAGLKGHRD